MTGKYDIVVQNRRLQYKFTIERNITVLRGDSATGKTAMIDIISTYQQNGEASGTYLQYDKTSLNRSYLNPQEQAAILNVMPNLEF